MKIIETKNAYKIFSICLPLVLIEYFMLFIISMGGHGKKDFLCIVVLHFIISLTAAISLSGLFLWIINKFKKYVSISIFAFLVTILFLSFLIFVLINGLQVLNEYSKFN